MVDGVILHEEAVCTYTEYRSESSGFFVTKNIQKWQWSVSFYFLCEPAEFSRTIYNMGCTHTQFWEVSKI
jgi:hypothetical protein